MRTLFAAPLAALALAGCAHTGGDRPEASIRTVTVKVATPVACPALTALGDEPAYPDTDEAIAAAGTIGQVARLYAKGRLMRVQRLAEYATAKAGCIF